MKRELRKKGGGSKRNGYCGKRVRQRMMMMVGMPMIDDAKYSLVSGKIKNLGSEAPHFLCVLATTVYNVKKLILPLFLSFGVSSLLM